MKHTKIRKRRIDEASHESFFRQITVPECSENHFHCCWRRPRVAYRACGLVSILDGVRDYLPTHRSRRMFWCGAISNLLSSTSCRGVMIVRALFPRLLPNDRCKLLRSLTMNVLVVNEVSGSSGCGRYARVSSML